jgi:signal transduction histidine kinase
MLNTRLTHIQATITSKDQNNLFHTILEISDEAIFILNKEDFAIIDCNNAALKLFEAESKTQLLNIQSFNLYNFKPFEFSIDKLNSELEKLGEYSQEMSFRTCKQNIFWGKLIQKNIGFSNLDYTILKITKSANYLKDDEWLAEILKSTSKTIGRQYFKQVTKLLCQSFDADCAFIARKTSNDGNKLKIFYLYGEDFKISFLDINSSFVENIMRGYTSFYPQGLTNLFPEDNILKEIKAESFIGSPLFDSSGMPFGLIGVLSTKEMVEIPNSRYMLSILSSRTASEIQRVRSKEMLRQQTKELAEINLMKDSLLNVISNELQTPMNTIQGYSSMLRNKIQDYDSEELSKKINVMGSSLRNLYMLMENLMDWSALQQGTIKSNLKKNNISNILEDIKPYLNYLSDFKHIAVKNKIPSVLNVDADSYLSRQVIKNITTYVLRNTVKNGSVTLDAQLIDGKWQFFISSDNHIAECKELDFALNSTTQEFYQSANDITISAAGLFISREFMRLQKGKMTSNCSKDKLEFIIEFEQA